MIFCCRDDLERAIKKLHVLGSGFQVIPVGNKRLVQSVPGELSMDDTSMLHLAQVLSFEQQRNTSINLQNYLG